ncbi:phosphoenolpyruvate--protein phosphotransferase [Polynucleobacter sphagniphilus]|jgi:phosphotransferase system enzyme I (PtsI)|uniref:Phosphoenolpyruvate-protein phosphotransferase n=1 Tax=Polynucleobacter sphagniphilus TaxID=1743169 RepID=A0AA43S503_9BURK|nr:phosphoenolpyruvate--protein phosphotransferase [Polynucleobacter sphagniphilus]MDH6241711.1 phosphotransferase system enzyme I (PtsI) [Polynucleobacter sphagniphilus]MDH6248857.1 phosphotransferase system enzyme I (PtsI) [Polynucleobacter sphagniphilus]MDH6299635.1 phosphotransferase system enzyme I (PtsI) [Polynucleobacter sphagniphilus]MDH6301402.1 phosphotransferase system enzyme I (PtsI) [Polynucleobacter sphagniphilus]MDH6502827.1 phosphotransferase system enzyme I (PtsI) [Polynucleob
MTFALHGIPVSKGIAIGKAVLISRAALEVSHYLIEAGKEELEAQKLINAFEQVRLELEQLRYGLPKDAPGEMAAFLDVHGMILADPALAEKPLKLIRSQRLNAAWALTTELNDLLEQFSEIEDTYLKERANDIRQVAERVLKALKSGEKESTEDPELALFGEVDVDAIIVAHDIAPHDMLRFKDRALTGFVTDLGGKTSHTAIVARSMEIPAVVGVRHASEMIRHGDWLILDGEHGVVIVAPDEQLLSEYRSLRAQALEDTRQLQQLKYAKTRTLDGVDISLFANIELPEDATQAVEVGAVGVGLFRSEFLFMDRNQALPDEEKQYQEYRRVVDLMHGLPVNIRTIDVGADKALGAGTDLSQTGTSPLGLRAIRWSLTEPEIFLTQLRAILRASAHGQARIMIPMLAHAKEIDETLRLIEKAKQQLHQRGKAFNPNIQVGAMIEIPAAALVLPLFIKRFDFLSIGTNDLIQYTLAIDRADHAVAHLYDPLHPAILYLLSNIISQAKRANVPISVCGEMAGDPALTKLLLALGLTDFSMHFSQLLLVKQEILQADVGQLQAHIPQLLEAVEPEAQAKALEFLLA